MSSAELSQPATLYITHDGIGFEHPDDFFQSEGHFPTNHNIVHRNQNKFPLEEIPTQIGLPYINSEGLLVED